MQPTVSVVITTKKAEKFIGDCLEAIRKQKYPRNKLEIIVVDNFSTDKTAKIARKYIHTILRRARLRYICQVPGRSSEVY